MIIPRGWIFYIPNNLSQRLIELYVTKRINRVKLHSQIAVIGEEIGNLDGFPEGFLLLGDAGHLYFRRAQRRVWRAVVWLDAVEFGL